MRPHFFFLALFVGLTTQSNHCFAQSGAGNGGGNGVTIIDGGDPKLTRQARVAQIQTFLKDPQPGTLSPVKKSVLKTIQFILDQKLTLEDAEFIVELRLLRNDLNLDVKQSRYQIQHQCLDYDGNPRHPRTPKGATAKELERGGDVCWAPEFLADAGYTEAALVPLAFHEHLHHFKSKNMKDANHGMAATFQKYYLLMKLMEGRKEYIATLNAVQFQKDSNPNAQTAVPIRDVLVTAPSVNQCAGGLITSALKDVGYLGAGAVEIKGVSGMETGNYSALQKGETEGSAVFWSEGWIIDSYQNKIEFFSSARVLIEKPKYDLQTGHLIDGIKCRLDLTDPQSKRALIQIYPKDAKALKWDNFFGYYGGDHPILFNPKLRTP